MGPTNPENPLDLDFSQFDPLVGRLRALDLRLTSTGIHLTDERLAELATGGTVSDAEATHLAGCDDCTGLWVAVAADLEALTSQAGEASALLRSPPPRPRRSAPRRGWWVMALCVAGAAAAALGLDAWRVAPSEPAPAPVIWPAPPAKVPSESPVNLTVPAASETTSEIRGPEDDLEPGADAVLGQADPTDPEDRANPEAPEAALQSKPAADDGSKTARPIVDAVPAASVAIVDERAAAVPEASPQKIVAVKARRRAIAVVPPMPDTPSAPSFRLAAPEARGPTRMAVDGPPRGYGHLRLNTRPAAQVYVDGTPRGWTPLVDIRLPEGPHDVRLVFESSLAAEPEQRFRVIIESDRIWRAVRDNRKR